MEMEETFPHRSRVALMHVNTSIKQRKTSRAHNKKSCLSESKKSHYGFIMRVVSINILYLQRNDKTLSQTHKQIKQHAWEKEVQSLTMSFVLIFLTSSLSDWHADACDTFHSPLCQRRHASENSAGGWEIMTCTLPIVIGAQLCTCGKPPNIYMHLGAYTV